MFHTMLHMGGPHERRGLNGWAAQPADFLRVRLAYAIRREGGHSAPTPSKTTTPA